LKRKFAIIVNPTAGKGRTFKKLPLLREITAHSDAVFDYYITQSPHHGTWIADAVHTQYDAVVAFGGDGTANEVVNGLAGSNTPFGIIPQGSGNDFARSIRVKRDLQKAVDILLRFEYKSMDLGTIDDRIFLNGVGIGFDGFVNYRSQKLKYLKGSFSYLYSIFSSLALWKAIPVDFEVDNHYYRNVSAYLIAIGNGWSCGGGMILTPKANIHDGIFDICHIRDIPVWKILLNFNRLKTGTIDAVEEVTIQRGKQINIRSERPLPIHFDGELYTMDNNEVKISVVPQAANVIGGWES